MSSWITAPANGKSTRRRQGREKLSLGPAPISDDTAPAKAARVNWARFIKKVFEVSRRSRFSEDKKPRYIPPIEDVEKVLALANPEQRPYLLVIANTMARVRESNRLKREDVKDNHLILRTRKAKCSDLTERQVDFNPTLREIPAALPRNGEYVFVNPRTLKKYDYRKKMLGTLCKRAGVKYFTFHCLRHLGASRAMKGGASITDIQKVLGHQRSTTTDGYLHSIGNLTDVMNKLEVK